VQIVKKILLAIVTLSVLIFALSGCGVFSSPELGKVWNADGGANIVTAFEPLAVRAYSLEIKLEFGGIWDSNKVKAGTVEFGPAVVTEERIDVTNPKYTVVDGTYDPTTKLLQLNCEENSNKSKITVRGRVTNKDEIKSGDGFIYKSSDKNNSIGTFTANK